MPLRFHTSMKWFTTAVFAAVLIPTLVTRGMFLDGVTYAAISRNLAEGVGTLFMPHYTQTLYPQFFEHPPFAFWIQSLFFRAFGDGFLTERIHSFFMALTSAAMVAILFRTICPPQVKRFWWLPVLLWISMPLVFWSYRNNMLENTATVLTLSAVFFFLKSLSPRSFAFGLLGGIFTALAFLTKGPVGLFPAAVPLIAWIVNRNRSGILPAALGFFQTAVILFLVIWMIPGLADNLTAYLDTQLIPALQGRREVTTQSHFHLLKRLVAELTLTIVLVLAMTLFKFRRSVSFRGTSRGTWLFLLIALSASLPLLITLKQRSFYLVPSMPFFVLAASLYIVPGLVDLRPSKVLMRVVMFVGMVGLLVTGVVSVINFGSYGRDEVKLSDVRRIADFLPEGTVVSTDSLVWYDWGSHAYFARRGRIGLDVDHVHPYRLTFKSSGGSIPFGYSHVLNDLRYYSLLRIDSEIESGIGP